MSSLCLAVHQMYLAVLVEQQPSAIRQPQRFDPGVDQLFVTVRHQIIKNNSGIRAVSALQEPRQLSTVGGPGPRVEYFTIYAPAWKIRWCLLCPRFSDFHQRRTQTEDAIDKKPSVGRPNRPSDIRASQKGKLPLSAAVDAGRPDFPVSSAFGKESDVLAI